MSINFLSRKKHIDRRIHNIFRSWLGLCHRFSCADEQFNVLSGNFFCDVSVDTIQNANPRNCSVFKQWFDHDINAITSFVVIEFHIQDWVDLRIWTNPPTRSGCCEDFEIECILDMLSALSQILAQLWRKTVLFQSSLRNRHLCKVWTISDLQEVLRNSWNNLPTSFPVPMMLSSEMWC